MDMHCSIYLFQWPVHHATVFTFHVSQWTFHCSIFSQRKFIDPSFPMDISLMSFPKDGLLSHHSPWSFIVLSFPRAGHQSIFPHGHFIIPSFSQRWYIVPSSPMGISFFSQRHLSVFPHGHFILSSIPKDISLFHLFHKTEYCSIFPNGHFIIPSFPKNSSLVLLSPWIFHLFHIFPRTVRWSIFLHGHFIVPSFPKDSSLINISPWTFHCSIFSQGQVIDSSFPMGITLLHLLPWLIHCLKLAHGKLFPVPFTMSCASYYLCPQLRRSWRGILVSGCASVRPCVHARVLKFHMYIPHGKIFDTRFFSCPELSPFLELCPFEKIWTKSAACHILWTLYARVLKFHIWIPHGKIADHIFFLVQVISLSGVMPLWKNQHEILSARYLEKYLS